MSRLVVLGAGGHGKVVAEAARAAGTDVLGFLDSRHREVAKEGRAFPILGSEDERSRIGSRATFVVALGDADRRLEWMRRLEKEGLRVATVVHPAAWVSPSAILGAGTVVLSNASVCADAELGEGVIVNTNASVDHDCQVGPGVHLCPGARLAGAAKVGAGAWIGTGACVIPGVTVGEWAVVGAGAVCVADVVRGTTVVGIPARPRGGSA